MIQKVLKVGSSAVVTIPKKSLGELGIKIGDEVVVSIDKKKKIVSYQKMSKRPRDGTKIARLTLSFINRYRKDLEELAKK